MRMGTTAVACVNLKGVICISGALRGGMCPGQGKKLVGHLSQTILAARMEGTE
jgi:hypothetical protein